MNVNLLILTGVILGIWSVNKVFIKVLACGSFIRCHFDGQCGDVNYVLLL